MHTKRFGDGVPVKEKGGVEGESPISCLSKWTVGEIIYGERGDSGFGGNE